MPREQKWLLPPRAEYAKPIDPRPIFAKNLDATDVCVAVAIMTFYAQCDGRNRVADVGPIPSASEVADVLCLSIKRVVESVRAFVGLGMVRSWLGPRILNEITISDQVAEECGVSDLPRRRALDSRLFFCPDLSAEAVRLWAMATISGQGAADAQTRLGWDEEVVIESGHELAAAGLVELRLGAEIKVRARRLPIHGLRVMEFRSEDLGRMSVQSARLAMARIREKKRRDSNRVIASQVLD